MPDGFFNTGDLGHFDEAGRFLFDARLKEVLKSNGVNVSPVEVEQLLIQHPDVKDAHVVGVPDKVYGEVIVAFVQSDCPLTEDLLRSFVKERAASFKVPHHIFVRNETQVAAIGERKNRKISASRGGHPRAGCALSRHRLCGGNRQYSLSISKVSRLFFHHLDC